MGSALGGLLGGGYTNYFSLGSRSYKVISQVQQRSRLTIDQVMQYQIATINGTPIPVSAIATVRQETVPQTDHAFSAVEFRHDLRRAGAWACRRPTALQSLQDSGARRPCRATC